MRKSIMQISQILKKWREDEKQRVKISDESKGNSDVKGGFKDKEVVDLNQQAQQMFHQVLIAYEKEHQQVLEKIPDFIRLMEASPQVEKSFVSKESLSLESSKVKPSSPKANRSFSKKTTPEDSLLSQKPLELKPKSQKEEKITSPESLSSKISKKEKVEEKKPVSVHQEKKPVSVPQKEELDTNPDDGLSELLEDEWDREMREFTKGLFEDNEEPTETKKEMSREVKSVSKPVVPSPLTPEKKPNITKEKELGAIKKRDPEVKKLPFKAKKQPETSAIPSWEEENSLNLESIIKSMSGKEKTEIKFSERSAEKDPYPRRKRKKNDPEGRHSKDKSKNKNQGSDKPAGDSKKKRYKWV